MSIDKAKVILTPNGYKAGKLYAIKPVDGSGDLTVNRNTSATRVNPSGLIESVGNNVPRLDYTGSDCPSLLVEPQRTNLVQYSEEFDNADWAKSNASATVTVNDALSPDGNKNADKLTSSNSTNSFISQNIGVLGDIATFSLFLKNINATRSQLRVRNSTDSLELNINWSALNISSLTLSDGIEAGFEDYGNGWFRVFGVFEYLENNPAHRIYSDTGSGSVFIWGAQVEEGSTPTSYIPTTGSTVTRNQDVLTNDYSSIIEPTYSVLLDVEGNKSRLKIEDTNTGFDLPLEGSGKIVMVVDNEITFHFPDNGQANKTVTYEKPADLRNWEIVAKLGAIGVRIASIENQVISQSRINEWVSGTVTSDWLQDYSTQTDLDSEFREQDWEYFPAIDLSSGTSFNFAWFGNNLTSFPAIDLSNGTNFTDAWRNNNLTSFPVIDLSSGTNFIGAWRGNKLQSFPDLNFSNATDFRFAWLSNNIKTFPANMFDTNNTGNYDFAFSGNELDQQSVDNILVSIEASAQLNNITGGRIDIDGGTNATPSATGQAAADSLRNTFGWTVRLNGY